jgi:hypothetical protein
MYSMGKRGSQLWASSLLVVFREFTVNCTGAYCSFFLLVLYIILVTLVCVLMSFSPFVYSIEVEVP